MAGEISLFLLKTENKNMLMHIVYITVEFVTEKISGGLGTYVDNMAKIMTGFVLSGSKRTGSNIRF